MSKTLCDSPFAEMPAPPANTRPKRTPITLTEKAIKRINELIYERNKPTMGIRIGVKSSGCTGLAYTFEFADVEIKSDEKIIQGNVTIYVDSKALLYLIGTELDFVETELESGFTFINPNEKARCGCGESFAV